MSRTACEGGPTDLANAAAARDGAVAGYGERPHGSGWYVAEHAIHAFQSKKSEWFARTEAMIADAEKALHL